MKVVINIISPVSQSMFLFFIRSLCESLFQQIILLKDHKKILYTNKLNTIILILLKKLCADECQSQMYL